jgi:hypothetical protein
MLDDWEARLGIDVSEARGQCAEYAHLRDTAGNLSTIFQALKTRHDDTSTAGNILYLLVEMEDYCNEEGHHAGLQGNHPLAHEYQRIAEILGNAWEQIKK